MKEDTRSPIFKKLCIGQGEGNEIADAYGCIVIIIFFLAMAGFAIYAFVFN